MEVMVFRSHIVIQIAGFAELQDLSRQLMPLRDNRYIHFWV